MQDPDLASEPSLSPDDMLVLSAMVATIILLHVAAVLAIAKIAFMRGELHQLRKMALWMALANEWSSAGVAQHQDRPSEASTSVTIQRYGEVD